MRIRRNFESLSFRLRSRCLRTATALRLCISSKTQWYCDVDEPYLLDQHVEVLWDFWCEACGRSLCQSLTKQRHECSIVCLVSCQPLPAALSSLFRERKAYHCSLGCGGFCCLLSISIPSLSKPGLLEHTGDYLHLCDTMAIS